MKKMRNTIVDNVNEIKNKMKDDFFALTVQAITRKYVFIQSKYKGYV